ncbi:DUF1049 domain-containing protein [Paenibacillus sp. IB182496]|uniref:DUF1049 domain-containing protein n=1 Tax=Paenibacillus sabuli TaxID=2772509 RepID=A0A927GTQ7_9BACL|nr:lipopolysaccharide assembly protein LapA domain-containing protein [Paenibacillus sabuli]MBD2846947.1 DUF1049 domain-containing protein [Paenibacillus sabuli]
MRTQWIIISALIFALITAVFAVINVESVEVNFWFTQTQTPLILVILASALLGGLMVFLFASIRQFRLQRQIRSLKKQVAEHSQASLGDTHTPEQDAPPYAEEPLDEAAATPDDPEHKSTPSSSEKGTV